MVHFFSRGAKTPIVSMTLVLFAGIVFPFSSATAVPITLNGAIPTGSASVTLHGDLTGGNVTLNSSSPLSELVINTPAVPALNITSASTIIDSTTQICGISICTTFGFESLITAVPNLVTDLTLPAWNFDLGGSADLIAGTSNLTGTPRPPSIIGTLSATSTPVFSGNRITPFGPVRSEIADSALNTILVLLNGSNPTLTLTGEGTWDTLSTGLSTLSLSQTGTNIEGSLALMSAMIDGSFSYEVDLEFDQSVIGVVGSLFEGTLENIIEDQISSFIRDTFNDFLDIPPVSGPTNYTQDCTGEDLGGTNFGLSCNINMQIPLSGTLSEVSNVPEPSIIALFTAGLFGLGFARRRQT